MKSQFSFVQFVIKQYKWRTILFLITIITAAILELFLVSLFFLFTNILIGSSDISKSVLGIEIRLDYFSFWFLSVAVFTTLARISIIIFQAKNMVIISNGLVTTIYEKIISLPLIKFKEKTDSEVISLLTTKIQHCADNILVQISQMISAAAISVGIIAALLIINTKTTLLAFSILLIIYFLIMKISKFKLKNAASVLSKAHDDKNKHLLNTIYNFEAIMVYNEYQNCINSVSLTDAKVRNSQKIIAIFGSAPRHLIEGLIIIIAGLPLIYAASQDGFNVSDLAFIGAFLVGMVRLLPLVNQFYAGLTSLRGSEYVAKDIMDVLTKSPKKSRVKFTKTHSDDIIIKTHELEINLGGYTITYPNLCLKNTRSLAIVGRSGVGKSKLLQAILGLIDISAGELTNSCFDEEKQKNVGIGYASQQPVVLSGSIEETVSFGAFYDASKIEQILEITDLKNEIKDRKFIGERGSMLSGGQLQRLAICNALYRAKQLLILDEPTSSLARDMSMKIMANVLSYCLKNNISVICVTHDPGVAALFENTIKIE